MAELQLPDELMLKKFWVFDPPPELFRNIEFQDLARLAVVQLKAQQAMLQVQEKAVAEAAEVFARYAK